MERFTTPSTIGFLYTISSIISVLAFLFITRLLKHTGNVRLTLILACTELTALILIGTTISTFVTLAAFIVFLIVNPMLYLSLDIFSETLIGTDEAITGQRKGLTLTLMSLAAVMAPLVLGVIVGIDPQNLYQTYFVSAGIFLVFIILIALCFRNFVDPLYRESKLRTVAREFYADRNISNVVFSHVFLQLFFSWMIIFFPLYLATELGFSWEAIGSLIAVGLTAYVLFEYLIGYLADNFFGEREMMAIGFTIIILSTASISWMSEATLISWMALMFISRVGASMVEATTESYFFKHTNGSDPQILSLFRLTRPLATIGGSLLGSIALLYLPFSLAFIVLAVCILPALYTTSRIVDTK